MSSLPQKAMQSDNPPRSRVHLIRSLRSMRSDENRDSWGIVGLLFTHQLPTAAVMAFGNPGELTRWCQRAAVGTSYSARVKERA